MFIILSSTKPKQHSGSTFVLAPFEPCTFHSVICVVEFVCFRVNSCWSLCVHRRCFHRRFCPPPPRRSFHHFSPPCCAPLPRFGKIASIRLRQVLLCAKGKVSRKEKKARCQSIQKKTRCQYIKTKKKKKERKSRTIQGNRITFGGQVFSPVGRHPLSLFWDLVQYSSLFQIVKFWKEEFRLL